MDIIHGKLKTNPEHFLALANLIPFIGNRALSLDLGVVVEKKKKKVQRFIFHKQFFFFFTFSITSNAF
jgi:hypothetical protein